MKPEEPKRIDIHEDELRGILQIVESHLTPAQYKILAAAVNMLIWLQFSVKEKSLSIARLGHMLFGKKTENVKNLKARTKNQTNSPADEAPTTKSSVDAGVQEAAVATESGDLCSEGSAVAEESIDSPACGDEGSKSSPEEKAKEADQQAGPADNKKDASLSEPTSNGTGSSAPPSPEEKKGHGRRPLDDYRVSKIIHIPHDMLKPGEECPLCKKGKALPCGSGGFAGYSRSTSNKSGSVLCTRNAMQHLPGSF